MFRWLSLILLVIVIGMGLVVGIRYWQKTPQLMSPVVDKILEKPLDKYTIENLGKRAYQSRIFLDEAVATTSAYTAYIFHFDSDGKKVTGLAHLPTTCDKCPVIAQFRGYVDLEIYAPGVGTQRSARVFAGNGFISLAPDGLGYGGSDMPSADVFEERFQSYTAALNLLAAIETWSKFNGHLFVWGHSNGGQVAISVLEISQKSYPTALWAPVSKPFPYSILYYTDEADDKGKALRKKLARFEQDYDVDLYSLPNYLNRITAPLQIHQGTADEAVPQKWSDELVKLLSTMNHELITNYYVYPGADHNMTGAWNTVINRDIQFYNNNLKSVVK